MYMAMYDEIDEGTAMYKMAKTQEDCPVLNPSLVALNEDGYDLPGDWLRIGTEIQKMLDGRLVLTDKLPLISTNIHSLSFNNSNALKVYPVPAKDILHISNVDKDTKQKMFNINDFENIVIAVITKRK